MTRTPSLTGKIGPALIAQVCVFSTMTGMRMATPLLALSTGHGTAAAGLLVGLFSLTQIFLSLPAGRFVDRQGLRRPVALCAIAASAAAALAAAWPYYMVLCAAAMLSGGAAGTVTIAVQRYVGHVAAPGELQRAFSMVSLAPATASVLGPVIAGLMIDHAGYRAAFAALALAPMFAWLLVRRARETGSTEGRARPHAEETAWALMGRPGMRRLIIMNTLMTSAWDFHSFMLPVLGHERVISASAIGMILGTFAVAAALSRIAMALLGRRLAEWLQITGAVAIAGVLLVIYPFMASPLTMAICSGLLGAALGCVQPVVLNILHHMTPMHRQGEALAMRLMFSNVSALAIPLLLGAASGAITTTVVFYLMGAFVAAGSHAGIRLREIRTGD